MEKVTPLEHLISPRFNRISGRDTWRQNVRCVTYVADKMRSSLGPNGAYKIVSYNRGPEKVVKITKDGIAILEELAIQYPPAVILAEAAKLQREEAGGGVTTFVIFLSALLKRANELLGLKIHPNTIIHGYQLSTKRALDLLESQATRGRNDILDTVDCQRKLLTPYIRSIIRESFELAHTDGRFDREKIRFLKKIGGSLNDSLLIDGIVLDRCKAHPCMPDKIENPRIAITNSRIGLNRLGIKMPKEGPIHIQLDIKSPKQIQAFWETEHKLRMQPIEKLGSLGVNVLLCQQPIGEELKSKLQNHNIFALESVDPKDIVAVAKATGARIVGNLNDLKSEDIGRAKQLFSGKIELIKTVTIKGCRSATFLLRGNTVQTIDELETLIKACHVVLNHIRDDDRVLAGGGAFEANLARYLSIYALELPGREQIVIQAYADALMDIPRCLAENSGLTVGDTLLQLKKLQEEGQRTFGINSSGCTDLVCEEPISIYRSLINRAFEVATLMLKIDELIISKEIPKFHRK